MLTIQAITVQRKIAISIITIFFGVANTKIYANPLETRTISNINKSSESNAADHISINQNDNGDSNELIILLSQKIANNGIDGIPPINNKTGDKTKEERLIEAVRNKDQEIINSLGGVIHVRHLIDHNDVNTWLTSGENHKHLDRLSRYLVLSYKNTIEAKLAEAKISKLDGVAYITNNQFMSYSSAPNDPYYPVSPYPEHHQWGMHAMFFSGAWDKTKGGAYIGIIDSIANMSHPDVSNTRPHLSFSTAIPGTTNVQYHGQHVTGVISANQNNSAGVTGGCPGCNVILAQAAPLNSGVTEAIIGLVNRGVQVINMSFGRRNSSCVGFQPICDAIAYAADHDIQIIAAAGNYRSPAPDFPANHPYVLSVGGAQYDGWGWGSGWSRWLADSDIGSSEPDIDGVMAPAKSIVSTVDNNLNYISDYRFRCSDVQNIDESGIGGDGYGSCTGTSMAAPHISALAGLLRSTAPLKSAATINDIIRSSGDMSWAPSSEFGHGLPNAEQAVNSLISSHRPVRITPLFSLYSGPREDHFYTTFPQMASAAIAGTIQPSNFNTHYWTTGNLISSYDNFPGVPWGWWQYAPKAQVWVFTTPENPFNQQQLTPLYRLSWKCGYFTPSPACDINPMNTDFTYASSPSEVLSFQSVGYKLDGIEGYIFPKNNPQPSGTVRLMRKYNPDRDDHAIFPETELNNMLAEGYTLNSGSEWLGYVYLNSNGTPPIIW